MENRHVLETKIETWKKEHPALADLQNMREIVWLNPLYGQEKHEQVASISEKDIQDAEERLVRFASFIEKAFPETKKDEGVIESPLAHIPTMQEQMSQLCGARIPGKVYVKLDSQLPISGSIKARGGVYEVLYLAESIAMEHGGLLWTDDYAVLKSSKFQQLFSQYTIVVGSTGNLGLSIGIMGAALGFRVIVHMSVDAKKWKKDMLRSKGVSVVEHAADYSEAVEAGRRDAEKDRKSYFIDDENSRHLFLGYAVAAKRLQKQLAREGVVVDEEHPLFVYLPCGVGGGPGGVTFGMKSIYKKNVNSFFVEPTHSPAMLLGLMTGLHEKISVQDLGIDNRTAADGLAVGRPSGLVGRMLERDISGVVTVQDENLYLLLTLLADSEGIFLEPSALAGFMGPMQMVATKEGQRYLEERELVKKMDRATHIVWATGGSMVPKEEMDKFYQHGLEIMQSKTV